MSSQIACRECRQQKVKCSGKETPEARCARCEKRNIDCIIDNNYKRTVKRKAIEQLEAEVALLKRKLRASDGGREEEKSLSSPTPQELEPGPAKLMPAAFTPSSTIAIAPAPVEPKVDSYECGDKSTEFNSQQILTLKSSTIQLLFKEYVTHYHRVLPVVEVHRGPEFIYNASTALFWTIMAIGSRRRSADLPEDISFERLCQAQEAHLGQAAVSPIIGHGKSTEFNLPSLYAVQAFLLCTLWPPPTASINADMSWTTSGIAVLTAIRAGLHCPGHASDFERIFRSNFEHRTNLSEQLVTWLATNALSQAIANMFGYPSAAKFRAHRQFLFHNIDLPPRVRHMYEIQRVAHNIELSLGRLGQDEASIDTTMTTSLIRIHAAKYDQIMADYGAEMDAWTLFTLHAGRAQLFSYYMFTEIKEEGVLVLYNSCLALLNHVAMQNDEYMRYLPVVSIMILWQSASVVARLWHSKWSTNLDKEAGERLYRAIIKKVMLSSIFEHDLPYRAVEIMTQMWATFSRMRRANHHRAVSATITLRSRMTASVFFDSLWTMREGAEIRSQAPTTLTKSSVPNSENAGQAKAPDSNLPPSLARLVNPPLIQQQVPVDPNWDATRTFMSPDNAPAPASPALSAMIDGSWAEMDSEVVSAIWRDVDTVMEDFGFGLGELPYISP